jgi:hypothetical protein
MSLQTYAVYTRCSHCGIYDKDSQWCALCGRPKDANGNGTPRAASRQTIRTEEEKIPTKHQ